MSYLASVRRTYETATVRSRQLFSGDRKAYSQMLSSAHSARNPFGVGFDEDQGLNPYKHYRHWVFSIINLIAKKAAGQELMLAKQAEQRDDDERGFSAVKTAASLPPSQRPWAGVKSLYGLHDEELELVHDHPLFDFLRQPNQAQRWWEFAYVTAANYFLGGLVYWLWMDDGDVPELWALPKSALTPIHDDDEGLFARYKLRVPGHPENDETIPGEQVCRIYLPDPRDATGEVSPAVAQMTSILTDDYIQKTQKRSFENGLVPQVVVKMGRVGGRDTKNAPRRRMSASQRRKVALTIRKMWLGAMRLGEPGVVDGLIEDIVPLSLRPPEMGFKESSELVKSRLCQSFGVSPVALGDTENPNRASAVVAQGTVNENVLNPFLEQESVALTSFVVAHWMNRQADARAARRSRMTMWVKPCVANDAELAIKRWDIGLRNGAVTDDEYRTNMLDLPPREDGRPNGLDNAELIKAVLKLLEMLNGDPPLVQPDQAVNMLTVMLPISEEVASGIVNGSPLPEEIFASAASLLPGIRKAARVTRSDLRAAKLRVQKAGESEVARLLARFLPGAGEGHRGGAEGDRAVPRVGQNGSA